MDLKRLIRDVPDFPQPGVVFKDITPLLQKPEAFRYALNRFTERYQGGQIEVVAAIEARGFIFGAPLALSLGAAFVPIRKKGKLPRQVIGVEYGLEYGKERVEVHQDGVLPGRRVLIVDDVLATGGTLAAARALVEELKGHVVGVAVLVELMSLKGCGKLPGVELFSLLQY